MSAPAQGPTKTPRRTFGPIDASSADTNNDAQLQRPGRISFTNAIRPSFSSQRRGSFVARFANTILGRENGDDEGGTPASERPPIPSALQHSGETYTTPLPILSMVVLSITMLGEFLSANVSTPFLLFMVKGFGELQDEADVAFWTGVIVSTFFLTQFLTSLLWATVAEKHGRRAVLFISLFGSAVTCLIFGTTASIKQAIAIRLLQGIFAGAVGVARGSVAFVTDASNEGRAYAILGFCWGFGGVAGAIIGGSFERPADKWPGVFENIPLFTTYPYLLPCGLAACITMTGSLLSLFLNPDGGPREGAIRLPEKDDASPPSPIPEEHEESRPPTPIFDDEPERGVVGALRRKISKKLSGYFSNQDKQVPNSPTTPEPPMPLSTPPPRNRAFSRTSRFNGSAYGYSAGAIRSRLASNNSTALRRGSMTSTIARRRGSNAVGDDSAERDESRTSDLNFAQRLLMANENAVTNIADLWVAAALNVDNEDPFESDTEIGSEDDQEVALDFSDDDLEGPPVTGRRPSTDVRDMPVPQRRPSGRRFTNQSQLSSSAFRNSPRRPSFNQLHPGSRSSPQPWFEGRRYSMVPSIFSHSGVRTPPAVADAQQQQQAALARESEPEQLAPIPESRRASAIDPLRQEGGDLEQGISEKQPSLFSQIPMLIIVQYGFLALHSTTHDQIFMSYLVTDYEAGGLNLNAGHFAQLIALMCLAQIFYQFYLYPNVGPPRGRFSHLSMFRVGSMLFIPSYITVILYRVFASPEDDGNFLLMTALAISTAVRYCAITFAYTAVSILLNYMTPPHAVGFANGIAQSIVSLARFLGPILGGYLWSVSIEKDPSGYPIGFLACGGFCLLAVFHSYFIR